MNQNSNRLTFGVLATGAGVVLMMQSLVAPALPTIQHSLHTSQSTAVWVMTANLLSASIFTPILGRIGDLFGKKRTLVAVLLVLTAGLLLAAVAPDIHTMIVARVVQGVGGGILPLSFGIIRDVFPDDRVSSSISNLSAVIAASGGLGIVLAGPIVGALQYQWLFWLPAGVVALTALLAHRYIPESPNRASGRVDWASALLLAGWLVALLLPVSQASSWGWGSARVLGLLALAVVLLALWTLVESRSASPVIDLRVMRLPAVWRTNTVALLFGAGMYGLWSFLPAFATTPSIAGYGFGASVTGAGLLMLPMLVAMFFSGLISARLEPLLGAKVLLVIAAGLGALGLAVLTAWHDQSWQASVAAGIFGLGTGLAWAAMPTLVVQSVPPAQTGAATGMNANIRTIGGAIGAAVMSSLVTGRLQPSGLPYGSGYTHGFALLTGACLAATLVALLVPARRVAGQPTAAERVPQSAGR
ncbi:MFS transporter [Streptomyces sp. NPDC055722]